MTDPIDDDVQILSFGEEKEPVIVIDNFSSQFAKLAAGAIGAEYTPVAMGYPGMRAPASPQYLTERHKLLADILRRHYGFVQGADVQGADYSIVTTAPEDLQQAQRMPHYDDVRSDLLALLHYIHCPDDGGTAFYRHRATRFETITPVRQQPYARILQEEMERYGPFSAAYLNGDNERFEKIGEVAARPNRMVIYRGRTLHSGCIRPDTILSPDPAIGRVTLNIFMSQMHGVTA